MNTKSNNSGKEDEENENEAVPLQSPKYPQVHIKEGAISNVNIEEGIHSFTQVFATKVTRYTVLQLKPNARTTTSRLEISQR